VAVITIEVRGLPAPQGSKRPVRLGNGKIGMVESSKAVGPWREAVRAEMQRALESTLFAGRDLPAMDGPMAVTLVFRVARAKGHYRSGRYAAELKPGAPTWPCSQPDLDKLARAVLDGLTAGGAWLDDSQVVKLAARKEYGVPGCRIEIEQLEER
jgi:Holliday junction resolvase RusA-like endonuclease